MSVTTREIAAYIVETLGSRSKLKLRSINDSVATISLDATRAQTALGWRPTVLWRDGIKAVVSEVVHAMRIREAKK